MSLFVCTKCSCVENTATSNCARPYIFNVSFDRDPTNVQLLNWKNLLGIDPSEPFPQLCCVCSPIWYTDEGEYGTGKIKKPEPGMGLWHCRFPRRFLPTGMFETGPNGNVRHKETKDEEYWKYAVGEADVDLPPKQKDEESS
jgi:hypothetical protein